MGLFQNSVKKFFLLADETFTNTTNLLKEAEKAVNSVSNLSELFLAVTNDKENCSIVTRLLPIDHESLEFHLQNAAEDELATLKSIESKLSELANELSKRYQILLKAFVETFVDPSTWNPIAPRPEHIVEWAEKCFLFQQSLYLKLAYALVLVDISDETTVNSLIKAVKPDSKALDEINLVRSFKLGPNLSSVHFSIYTADEIRQLSVVEVRTPLTLNHVGHPLRDGLYDLRMGPGGSSSDPCDTCKLMSRNCNGHVGHIELPLPVINPLFHRGLYSIFRLTCFNCHRLLIPGRLKPLLVNRLQLLDSGLIEEAEKLDDVLADVVEESTPHAVAEVLARDAIAGYMAKVPNKQVDASCTALIESLKAEFIGDALKHQVRGKACIYCKTPHRQVTMYQNRILLSNPKVNVAEKFKDEPSDEPTSRARTNLLLATESRQILREVWKQDGELLAALFPLLKRPDLEFPTDLFYMEVILVPPPKTRPLNYLHGKILEGGQSRLFKSILNDAIILRNIRRMMADEEVSNDCKAVIQSVKGKTLMEKCSSCWSELQSDVDHLLDVDMNKLTLSNNCMGLKQLVEKKEGVLRMHMMGKRVNYAARSVITPDPNLNIEEIGIPEEFAKKLTYPVPVNMINAEELRRLVEAGPDEYPGATLVEKQNGRIIQLLGGKKNRTKRASIAKLLLKSTDSERGGGKIVHRHLINGDMVLLNRQPTLHKPSIMAHRARILKSEKTLRMHYSNCKSYNADFDGDEMNLHCPQNEIARSEAMNIAAVPNQYLVPKDGTPLGGLIQDHVIAGVNLTVRGQMFNRADYNQLVYQALANHRGNIQLLPPCIIKPVPLWSGKQIISTILLNIIPKGREPLSLKSTTKISLKSWMNNEPRKWKCGQPFDDPRTMSEAEVIVHRCHLLCGVLDKQHCGATPFSITHCLFELYGGQCSSRFLNSLGKLFTAYLQYIGFTIGVEDILVLPDADSERRMIIENVRNIGDDVAARALDLDEPTFDLRARLEEAYYRDPQKFKAKLDNEYKKALDEYTNSINKVALPKGLEVQFPRNNLQLMVISGAKGSTVNTMQISCLLGQIELEGKRPPLMLSGRSLPSFRPFETSPKAGGYVDGRFMTGITPQDFFFHCMAGREGLIDTAVKTSRSGYLQRCLIKHLEGVSVGYDHTVRNYDGTVIQFKYGEDGMDVSKAQFLKANQMEFLYRNRKVVMNKKDLKQFDRSNDDDIKNLLAESRSWKDTPQRKPKSPFTTFTSTITLPEKYLKAIDENTGRIKAYRKALKKWRKKDEENRKQYAIASRPDPVADVYRPYRDFGAICESLDWLVDDYIQSKPMPTPKVAKAFENTVRNLIGLKSMTSLCQPGEPVGLLAAQSVGEPSTQMTLNTFHFAGRGEMNVTLGIPRLREILMTASKNIKTPSMDIPLFPSVNAERKADKLLRTFRRVTVSDVLEMVSVKEQLEITPSVKFTYTVRFNFLPYKCYRKEFSVSPKVILKHMEKIFFVTLSKNVRLMGKKFGDIIQTSKKEAAASSREEEDDKDDFEATSASKIKKTTLGDLEESSDEEEEKEDDDATAARRRAKHQEAREYDECTDSESERSDDEPNAHEEDGESKKKEEEDEEAPVLSEAVLRNAESRMDAVVKTFDIVDTYRFDMVNEEWCECVISLPVTLSKIDFSSMLREVCEASVIYQIPGIKRAIVRKDKGEVAIKTEGINIVEICKFDHILNMHKLYCNDVHQMASIYGIEAAGRVVVRELKSVFQVYGITVDPRHLLLIADYMTMHGSFIPMSRTGMAFSSSPLQQMSFESCISFLRNAVFAGKSDSLTSPSARIMVGRVCYSGTGCFELYDAVSAK